MNLPQRIPASVSAFESMQERMLSHAKLVQEQVERDAAEHSVGSGVTAKRIEEWFKKEHGCDWRDIIKQEKDKGMSR